LEDALLSQNAHRIHYIRSEPEWDDLWDFQPRTLFKDAVEVDVRYLTCMLMHQYIITVPITKADDIADHGPDSTRLRKVNSGLIPQIWTREVLSEPISQHRLGPLFDILPDEGV